MKSDFDRDVASLANKVIKAECNSEDAVCAIDNMS